MKTVACGEVTVAARKVEPAHQEPIFHPTLDKLKTLKFTGMAAACVFQMKSATIEDIDLTSPRGLDPGLIQSLAACRWVREHLNVLIAGPTGVGKTWLACALAHKACREGHTAQYFRLAQLLRELTIAKGDGRYTKLLARLARTEVLVIDDLGLVKPNAENRRDLLEVLEERHGRRSTVAASQLPIDQWHDTFGDPTLADAILDRLNHNAYPINMKGDMVIGIRILPSKA